MAALNETPSGSRLHIGVFGRTNSGKSAFINAFIGQELSIVADHAGTTTDPVYKAMEIYPLGPCTIIDTAGFDDGSALGAARVEKTRLAAQKTDVAIILFAVDHMEDLSQELAWIAHFRAENIPFLLLLNKSDLTDAPERAAKKIEAQTEEPVIPVSALQKEGIREVKEALADKMQDKIDNRLITGDLVGEDDLVLLVMPQDIQAPKGRLILPQVQTLRELLDKKCMVMSATTDKYTAALAELKKPPKLIITDSQVFPYVCEHKPAESMLTSFSVLFAAYKGDLPYYVEGAKALDRLTEQSRVLIAECCTHAPLTEDIGREKIPNMLRKRVGAGIIIDNVSGTDFPEGLSAYDLIIQCGACMFNRRYVMSRVNRAKEQRIPMTNYGVVIAHLSGILPQVTLP